MKWQNGIKEKGEGKRAEKHENILSLCPLSSVILFPLSIILSISPFPPLVPVGQTMPAVAIHNPNSLLLPFVQHSL